MGNSSTKEAPRTSEDLPRIQDEAGPFSQAENGSTLHQHSRNRRSRHDPSSFGLNIDSNLAELETKKETKQERDARRAARERANRLKERERSLKNESVDGGYLVTLGTYTGPEDFSKSTVRQLMLERRIAPFWRGLDHHSDSWTEHQLVAAARGLPIPAPDEIPQQSPTPPNLSSSPIPIRGNQTGPADTHVAPFLSYGGPSHSQNSAPSTSSPLFRHRSKTLTSYNSKTDSQAEFALQEIQLPHEPQLNGQPIEAHLYKDVLECPICFLQYPPYLNRTRCCDQPLCSECFVQIKRPDPHFPEHTDPNIPVPNDEAQTEDPELLISEPATCPFCVQSEFGITYDPPSFRRGLAYAESAANLTRQFPRSTSAISASPLSNSNGVLFTPKRRRGQSLSVVDPSVISTDRVRPDWAKKLAEARANAARRGAFASALHQAAYMGPGDSSGGRRRRFQAGNGNEGTLRAYENLNLANMELLMAALGEQGSSRGRRALAADARGQELEEMMLAEAVRQSLQAEDERRRKEEKSAAKQAKKDEKQKAKDQKKAEKAAKKSGMYSMSNNASSFFSAAPSSSSGPPVPTEDGKGKQRASDDSPEPSNAILRGFNPLSEPTSTLNMETSAPSEDHESPRQMESKRSIFDPSLDRSSSHPRQLSNASSAASSSALPSQNSSRYQLNSGLEAPELPAVSTGPDSAVFGSLAAMIGKDSESTGDIDTVQKYTQVGPGTSSGTSPTLTEGQDLSGEISDENRPPEIRSGQYGVDHDAIMTDRVKDGQPPQ